MISAIVSAYYAEEYIINRLGNLFNQNTQLEIIVVAQEGSVELDAARAVDVVVVPTIGIPTIYDAWNMGIRMAKGDYITNANCDDRLYPGALQKMATVLDKNPDVGLVFSAVDMTIEGEHPKYWKRISNKTGVFKNALETLKAMCIIGPMPMWRRNLGYFDGTMKHAGDYEFFMRVAHAGVGFYFIEEALGVYDQRMSGNEHKNKASSMREHVAILSKYLDVVQCPE